MQFKENGRRIDILAYSGYDKEKKRSVVKRLGSIDRFTYKPITEGLLECMTVEQKDELQSYIDNKLHEDKKRRLQSEVNYLSQSIKNAADGVNNDACITQDQVDAIFDAFDVLKKAMRKQGFTRTRKPKKSTESDNQASMFE